MGSEGKVEVQIDYITSHGDKLLLTIAAEGQAKSGHDILAMAPWWPHTNAEMLEPVNDIMDPIIKQNGDVNDTAKYLGQANDKWLGVPTCNNQIKGPCSRIDLMKKYANIACRRCIRRAARRKPTTGRWTTSRRLQKACQKGGFPFGIGLVETSDNVDTAGAIFRSFGAESRVGMTEGFPCAPPQD